jgi:hypothetical protein
MQIQPAHVLRNLPLQLVSIQLVANQAHTVAAERAPPDRGGHEAAGEAEEGAVYPEGRQGADEGALRWAAGDGGVERAVATGDGEGVLEGFADEGGVDVGLGAVSTEMEVGEGG